MFDFPKMLTIFKDAEMQANFEQEGYVVVPFYNELQVKELNALYDLMHPDGEQGFYASNFSSDKNYRSVADRTIRAISNERIEQLVTDHKVVSASFISKYPGPDSAMSVHQDMTLVDESIFTGINIWVPLVDLTPTNGALQVLPKSHRIFPTYRGSSIPGIYETTGEEIKARLKTLYLKAGEGVIFDQSIIHYSAANMSDKVRVVANTYFTHKDATYRTCYWQPDYGNKVELFEQDDTFMTDFEQFGQNIHARPKMGTSLGFVEYDFPRLSHQLLFELYGGEPPVKRNETLVQEATTVEKPIFKSLLERIFS